MNNSLLYPAFQNKHSLSCASRFSKADYSWPTIKQTYLVWPLLRAADAGPWVCRSPQAALVPLRHLIAFSCELPENVTVGQLLLFLSWLCKSSRL